jgi:hypothetical protein
MSIEHLQAPDVSPYESDERTAINHISRRPIMSKVRFTSLILCASLAACANDTTTPALTAPDAKSALSEAPADLGVAFTLDGPFDFTSSSEETTAQLAGAQLLGALAASPQAASGGRASGHVGFPSGLPGVGLADESYSFVALSTDPATPFAAKGQYELTLTTVAGVTNKVHGEVICMGITGNTARIAGQITKAWRNGVQIPIPARTHNVWVVIDNGEGQATPDQVSPMGFQTAPVAATHCAVGTPTIVFPDQEGNVQVQP